jgi:hypothetical protein
MKRLFDVKLEKSVGVLVLCNFFAKFLTYKKLLRILLFYEDTLSIEDKQVHERGKSSTLVAIILEISFAKAWISFIGRKSVISSAPSFFGMWATFAELS